MTFCRVFCVQVPTLADDEETAGPLVGPTVSVRGQEPKLSDVLEHLKDPASFGYGAASLGPGHGAGKTRSGCIGDPISMESASGI